MFENIKNLATASRRLEGRQCFDYLFCNDVRKLSRSIKGKRIYPWSELLHRHPRFEELETIASNHELDGRTRLIAFKQLESWNLTPKSNSEVLAVIMELAFPDGREMLAVYKNGEAIFVRQSGHVHSISGNDEKVCGTITHLLKQADMIVQSESEVIKTQPLPAKKGNGRLCFLMPDKTVKVEYRLACFFQDIRLKFVIQCATDITNLILEKAI